MLNLWPISWHKFIKILQDAIHVVRLNQTQWDAAEAMNFSYFQILKEVIFPQAWKVILPPAFSFFIMFIKIIYNFFVIGINGHV